MKYDNVMTEAAHCLVVEGLSMETIGTLSEDGDGPQWQGLVYVARYRLLRCTGDQLEWSDRLVKKLKAGHEALVWAVEAHDGEMVTHKLVDADAKGHADAIAALKAEFAEVTQHYGEVVNLADFQVEGSHA